MLGADRPGAKIAKSACALSAMLKETCGRGQTNGFPSARKVAQFSLAAAELDNDLIPRHQRTCSLPLTDRRLSSGITAEVA
jgi:hypothetical protein